MDKAKDSARLAGETARANEIGAGRGDPDLWFCPPCGALHPAPTCPSDPESPGDGATPFKGPVHLCACCALVPVRRESEHSSFFCPECGPPIVEVNRSAQRLVVPVCPSPSTNCALLVPGDRSLDASEVVRITKHLEIQITKLADAARARARYLAQRVRFRFDELLPLDAYVRRMAVLRADVFLPPAALQDLLPEFCEYVLEVPAESPDLRARIKQEARTLVLAADPRKARDLLDEGPAALLEACRRWAWEALDRTLPVPSYLSRDAHPVLERRASTVAALMDAAVEQLERAHGPATRPAAPTARDDLPITLATEPGTTWPEDLPGDLPDDACVVVGLDGPPSDPDDMLCIYQLSTDAQNARWVLWVHVHGGDGLYFPAPAAWCPKDGVPSLDAAYLLLEAVLRRDLTRAREAPRPRAEMRGLLTEDLANVLLDQLWVGGSR